MTHTVARVECCMRVVQIQIDVSGVGTKCFKDSVNTLIGKFGTRTVGPSEAHSKIVAPVGIGLIVVLLIGDEARIMRLSEKCRVVLQLVVVVVHIERIGNGICLARVG